MNQKLFVSIKSAIAIVVAWGSLSMPVFAQEQHSEKYDGHKHNGMEVGLSVGYTYLKEEKKDALNLHLHVMKRLSGDGFKKYLSIGFGAEAIVADEKHYGAMITLAVHPWHSLILSISPGVELAKHDGEWESGYATHLEATDVFEGSNFHYGAVVGYSKTNEDQHYTVGIHFGMPC